jgi:acyl carrier protein
LLDLLKEPAMPETGVITDAIRGFLRQHQKSEDIDLDTRLFADGIGLDSLQTAELSVVLEDTLGSDPFSEGEMPQSVGEIIDFYTKK